MSNLQPAQNAMISSFRVEPNAGKESAAARPPPQDAAANYANYSFHSQPYPHYAPMGNNIKGESMEQPQDQMAFFQSYQQPIHPTATSPDTDYRRQSWASSKKDDDGLYSPSSNDSSNDIYETETQRAQLQVIFDKKRRRRESHNAVERRRRDNINDRIQELLTLLPEGCLDPVNKPHKGFILRKSVDYIRNLRHDLSQFQQRVQELEATLEHYKIKQHLASNEPSLAYGLMSPPTQAIDSTMRSPYQSMYVQQSQPPHNNQIIGSYESTSGQPVLKWDH
ncbi:hypothetical protein INT43_006741 [Umbelopsis isabellina]|uniref:BHLH domain-containing protein n=1 Tax=Mortierella isabellina TaxID=91625 RepID=A0A8H7Q1C8_MORIS|nr:hypothetical protein INT43_006741 [Umbelopsis isabellina]